MNRQTALFHITDLVSVAYGVAASQLDAVPTLPDGRILTRDHYMDGMIDLAEYLSGEKIWLDDRQTYDPDILQSVFKDASTHLTLLFFWLEELDLPDSLKKGFASDDQIKDWVRRETTRLGIDEWCQVFPYVDAPKPDRDGPPSFRMN